MAAHTEGVEDQAFVTLATNDTYALGAMVLAYSLRHAQTSRRIVCLITDQVTSTIRDQMHHCFDELVEVNVFDSRDTINLGLLGRGDLGETFTKFHCWRLTQYSKCVFLDADTLVLQNVDDLFDREELSAAPDAGWPDCFNSGVFVFKPSLETYQEILNMALTIGSFDGGDQGLLNLYFSDWATKDIAKHLPFVYNVVSQAFYSYLPAFRQFGKNTKIVHFIGAMKPWHHTLNRRTGQVEPSQEAGHNAEFLQMWWDLFMTEVQPKLDPKLTYSGGQSGIVGQLASLRLEGPAGQTYTREELSDRQRQYAWERGQVDYVGKDSFEHIQAHITEVLNGKRVAPMSGPSKPAEPEKVAPKPDAPKPDAAPQ